MKAKSGWIAGALLALALAGCSNQREPASQALAGLESSVAEFREDAERFAEEQHDALQERLARLRADFDNGEYKTVVTEAPEVQQSITELRDTVARKRREFEEASARATEAWNGFAAEMPRHIQTLERRLEQLVKQRRVGRGATEESLLLDNVRNIWSDANNLFTSGQPVEAAARAEEARASARELAQKLGAKLE